MRQKMSNRIEVNLKRSGKLSSGLLAMLLFLSLDAVCFRTGFYRQFIEPNSGAGVFKQRLKEARQNLPLNENWVAVMGDSRMSEGFSARLFDDFFGAENNLKALNLAMPGSTLRVWYYFLEQIDQANNLFTAIIVPLPTYSFKNVDPYGDPADHELDLNFLLPMATNSQLIDFYTNLKSTNLKSKVILGEIVRCSAFHQDISSFLKNPAKRMEHVRAVNRHNFVSDYLYEGQSDSLAGISNSEDKLELPSSLSFQRRQELLTSFADRRATSSIEEQANYCRFWLNKIVDKYEGTSTKIIVIRVPSDLFKSGGETPQLNEVLSGLSRRPHVFVVAQNTFVDLEKPEYFHDDVHLNSRGRRLFSERLCLKVSQLLTGSASLTAQKSTVY